MTKLVIRPYKQKDNQIDCTDFITLRENNKMRSTKIEKKLKAKLQSIRKNHIKNIFLELTQNNSPADDSMIESISNIVSSPEFIFAKSDLKRAFQNVQLHSLQKTRATIRMYLKVPYLYTDSVLQKSHWNKVIQDVKHDLHVSFPNLLPFCKSSYINIVRKNMQEFYTTYQDVITSYNHSILQTQFKLQLIFGMDVSREILSYV